MFKTMTTIPEPPDAADSLVDVGKECDGCGRNLGMFPLAPVCSYCRPVEQANGDIIEAIGYSPAGTDDIERVPNTYISIGEDDYVTIDKGQHKDCVWLNDGPQLSSEGASSFFLGVTQFPPPTYHVRFR